MVPVPLVNHPPICFTQKSLPSNTLLLQIPNESSKVDSHHNSLKEEDTWVVVEGKGQCPFIALIRGSVEKQEG